MKIVEVSGYKSGTQRYRQPYVQSLTNSIVQWALPWLALTLTQRSRDADLSYLIHMGLPNDWEKIVRKNDIGRATTAFVWEENSSLLLKKLAGVNNKRRARGFDPLTENEYRQYLSWSKKPQVFHVSITRVFPPYAQKGAGAVFDQHKKPPTLYIRPIDVAGFSRPDTKLAERVVKSFAAEIEHELGHAAQWFDLRSLDSEGVQYSVKPIKLRLRNPDQSGPPLVAREWGPYIVALVYDLEEMVLSDGLVANTSTMLAYLDDVVATLPRVAQSATPYKGFQGVAFLHALVALHEPKLFNRAITEAWKRIQSIYPTPTTR